MAAGLFSLAANLDEDLYSDVEEELVFQHNNKENNATAARNTGREANGVPLTFKPATIIEASSSSSVDDDTPLTFNKPSAGYGRVGKPFMDQEEDASNVDEEVPLNLKPRGNTEAPSQRNTNRESYAPVNGDASTDDIPMSFDANVVGSYDIIANKAISSQRAPVPATYLLPLPLLKTLPLPVADIAHDAAEVVHPAILRAAAKKAAQEAAAKQESVGGAANDEDKDEEDLPPTFEGPAAAAETPREASLPNPTPVPEGFVHPAVARAAAKKGIPLSFIDVIPSYSHLF